MFGKSNSRISTAFAAARWTIFPAHTPELKKLGYMTTLVIVIDGSVIVGFDATKIDQALQG